MQKDDYIGVTAYGIGEQVFSINAGAIFSAFLILCRLILKVRMLSALLTAPIPESPGALNGVRFLKRT